MEFKVGDKVRVRKEFQGSSCRFGGTTPKEDGVITTVKADRVWIDFPTNKDWHEDPTVLELANEPETTIPKVYKALILTKEGTLESIVAGGKGCEYVKSLTYKEGEITYAPEGSMGIFADPTSEEARDIATNNDHKCREIGGTLVVHEAIPLGSMLPKDDRNFSKHNRYPAILLGKRAWAEPSVPTVEAIPVVKEPEWIDVTEECTFGVYKGGMQGTLVEMLHRGTTFAWMGINGIVHPVKELQSPGGNYGYKLEPTGSKTTDGAQYFKVLRRTQ